ncbi:MAG: phosphatidate cytidylyltransferase [Desulfovibrionaceae bacterium]
MALPTAAAIIFGGWVLAVVLVVVVTLALWEFYGLFDQLEETRMSPVLKALGVAAGAALLAVCALRRPELILLSLLAVFWVVAMHQLVVFSRDPEAFDLRPGLATLMGLLYLPLSLQSFLWLPPLAMLLVLAATAISDTAALYAGKFFGKRKIWPAVSPKKTWAGSAGSALACVGLTMVYGLLLGDAPWWAWLALGAALNAASQFGDFFESALKRRLGVKDSGRILPGHGGILDRIDGLLFVLPVYLLARVIHPFFASGGLTP